jgi:uncharacterized membrane protein YraQ (UPF0718 family)
LFVQALPFLLIGAAVAASLRGKVANRVLEAARRRPRLAAALAPLIGAGLPLCDCGLVPVARALRDRLGATAVNGFVAGAPLTNPIVIVSTLLAFPGQPGMLWGRLGVGLAVAMLVSALAPPPSKDLHEHEHPNEAEASRGGSGFLHAIGSEVARTGPILVLGALAAGLVKGLVPPGAFSALNGQPLLGAVAMMGFAFVLSLCSQADAFIAASLPIGPLPRLAFLVLGPMLDLRLSVLYRREFGTRWLLGYAAVVIPSVLVLATAWTTWLS